jgi:serine/threonine-protein kinase
LSEELDRLLEASTSLDEALRLFAHLRSTPEEGKAIEQLLVRDARSPLGELLLVAVATALLDRGEESAALRVLTRASSNDALILHADVLSRRGDAAAAVALVERVLLRDLDWPGARERHARGLAALGLRAAQRAPDPATATMMTSAPDAPFALLREIARGGAGVVYQAEDRELGRRVALKVYHRPDRDRAQLLHEARVAVSLEGPGLVRVFDVDPERGWLAMEWAQLGALRSRLTDPIERWAPALARALARVHAAGWVHHDVKPANVLFRSPDDPLLTDFGTARRRGEASPPGSLGFVSPERLAGRDSDPRDDVYGFGRVLEEALDATKLATTASDEQARVRWLALASACTGPDAGRPADAGALAASMTRGYVR